jgi:hypothetical protein
MLAVGAFTVGLWLGACSGDDSDAAEDVVAVAADASPLIYAGGDADLLSVPDGPRGEVSVVSRSTELDRFGEIHVVIRNMTSDAVGQVEFEGALLDAAGEVIAAGQELSLEPRVIRPGEIGFGHLYFRDIVYPDAVEAEVRVVGWDDASASEADTDVAITQARVEGDDLVGTITNSGDDARSLSEVRGLCFDADGVPYGRIYGPLAVGSIGPGGSATFSENFPDAARCAAFLVTPVE